MSWRQDEEEEEGDEYVFRRNCLVSSVMPGSLTLTLTLTHPDPSACRPESASLRLGPSTPSC